MPPVAIALATLVPGHVGGSETYVRGLLGALARRPDADRVTVLTGRAAGPVVPARLARHAVPAPMPAAGIPRAAVLIAGVAAGRPMGIGVPPHDVLHVPLTVPIPRTGAPMALTLHDVNHHDLPHLFPRAERRFRRWAYDEPARRAAVVLVPSRHTRARALAHLDLDPDRVVVASHGLDHGRLHPGPAAADPATLAGLPPLPERFAIYPATLLAHKDHETLLRALAHAADRGLHLVLTGHRDARRWTALRALAGELGVYARVHHLARVPDAALAALMRRATLLAFPSRYEGFGLPVAEAMACGLPVVATRAASIPEVAGDAALYVAPGDHRGLAAALDVLGERGPEAARLRAAGLRRAQAFTWEACADGHADAYRRAAGR